MTPINSKIKNIYEYKNNKFPKEKKSPKMKQNQPIGSRVDYNKDFSEKTPGEIFSEGISSKYTQHPSEHNKKSTEPSINDEDEKNGATFNDILNSTFLDSLNHPRGSKTIEESEGSNNLKDFLKNAKIIKDKEYCTILNYFVNNFEKIIMDKKSRIKSKK